MWNKMKKLNIPTMLLAVTLAVLLWFYVDFTVKPDTRVAVRGIEVEFTGEDRLEQRDLMLADHKPHTISLTLTGPRSVVSQINRNNTSIKVDVLSQVHEAGRQKLEYTISFPSSVNMGSVKVSRSANSIEAEVVKQSTRTIRVEPLFSGSVAPGYLGGQEDFAVFPGEITIRGEDETVKRVSHAVVELDEAGLMDTWEGELPVMLVDSEGQLISEHNLELSETAVQGVFPVRHYKDVPLGVTFLSGGGATKEDVTDLKLSPSSVRVIGTEEALAKLDELTLTEIDLGSVITTYDETLEIKLPKGVIFASDDENTAHLSFGLSDALSTHSIETTNISLRHTPKNRTAQVVEKSIKVDVRGRKESLKLLRSEYVKVEADLSSITPDMTGEVTLPAKVKVQGMADVGVMGSYSVTVQLN